MNLLKISTIVALVLLIVFIIMGTFFKQYNPQIVFFAFGFGAVILSPILFFTTTHTSSGFINGLAVFNVTTFILLYMFLMTASVETTNPTTIETIEEISAPATTDTPKEQSENPDVKKEGDQ